MKTVKHNSIRDKQIITSFALLTLDAEGVVVDPILTEEQIEKLLRIPLFKAIEIEDKVEEVEEEVVEEEIDLNAMKVSELKAFAKENGIELEATKKADIIAEIEEKL